MKLKECDGCKKLAPIFKNQTVNGVRYRLCQSCARKGHVGLKPNKTQIIKLSEKKVLEGRLYSIKHKQYMAVHERCEINTPGCTSVAVEIHHTAYRTGTNYLDTNTWKATCRACHQWVHANPKEARELGFLI